MTKITIINHNLKCCAVKGALPQYRWQFPEGAAKNTAGLESLSIYNNIASCAIWLLNMISYIKGGKRAKGISESDYEANIWPQQKLKWEEDKASQWETS